MFEWYYFHKYVMQQMISGGSCDTEDRSNDVEHHRNKLHFTVYSHRKQMI